MCPNVGTLGCQGYYGQPDQPAGCKKPFPDEADEERAMRKSEAVFPAMAALCHAAKAMV